MVDPAAEPDIAAPGRPALPPTVAERWAQWRHDPRLVTTGLIVVALAAGAWWLRLSSGDQSGASPRSGARAAPAATVAPSPSPTSAGATSTSAAVYVVDVVGAVRKPGVVSLAGSARVVDAVNAAGGALPNADLDRINLAAHLVDGMRIAVPRRGAPSDPAGPTNDPGGGGGPSASGPSGAPTPSTPLDLNTASEAQLEALPGIGPSLAQAIVQEREHEGGFHSVDDLRRVRGIGDVRFAQIRSLVTV